MSLAPAIVLVDDIDADPTEMSSVLLSEYGSHRVIIAVDARGNVAVVKDNIGTTAVHDRRAVIA